MTIERNFPAERSPIVYWINFHNFAIGFVTFFENNYRYRMKRIISYKSIAFTFLAIVFLLSSAKAGICGLEFEDDELDFGDVPAGELWKASINLIADVDNWFDVEIVGVEIASGEAVFTYFGSNKQTIAPGEAAELSFSVLGRQNVFCEAAAFVRVRCGETGYSIPLKLTASVRYSDYYSSTFDLVGDALLLELHNLTSNHISLDYKDARERMYVTIYNEDGVVEGVYTGRTIETNVVPDHTVFNTEHTWPRSLGSDDEPEKSDLFHIYPTYSNANNRRANFPFDYVADGTVIYEDGGSRLGRNSNGVEVFEPRDEHKGNAARSLMYFAVCYGNKYEFLTPYEEVLREFAELDPPDDLERRRCDQIYTAQKCRNPFIDYPEFLERIPSISKGGDPETYAAPIASDDTLFFDLRAVSASMSLPIYVFNAGEEIVEIESLNVFGENAEFYSASATNEKIDPGEIESVYVISTVGASDEAVSSLEISYSNGEKDTVYLNSELGVESVEDRSAIDYFNVSPNPASEEFVVEFSGTTSATSLKVYDALGREIADISDKLNPAPAAGFVRIRSGDLNNFSGVALIVLTLGVDTETRAIVVE